MINSTERSDILVFNSYLCHVSFLFTCYVCSTKKGEISDISKYFENFISQALGVLTRIYAAELRRRRKIMIKSIIDSRITEQLYKIYKLDIDGFVNNRKQVKTFNFEYEWPVVDFLEPIFMPLFQNIDSNFIYLTKGYDIALNEIYSKFAREDFIEFMRGNKTYTPRGRSKESIDIYYMIGLTIFDETFEWLIHNNVDVGYLTFSFQVDKFNNEDVLNSLMNNKWFVHDKN